MKRTAIYLRVSTDKQAQEGDSIPAQRDALKKYVKEHNYILVGEYLDDGVPCRRERRLLQGTLAQEVQGIGSDMGHRVAAGRTEQGIRKIGRIPHDDGRIGNGSTSPPGTALAAALCIRKLHPQHHQQHKGRQVFENFRQIFIYLCRAL